MNGWPTSLEAGWMLTAGAGAVSLMVLLGATGLRSLCAMLGCGTAALSSLGLQNPLASMAGYTAALMTLNQITPPLLLLAVPTHWWHEAARAFPRTLAWALDPWVGGMVFVLLSISVSVPGIFKPALAEALFSAPLGLLELLAGLLVWAQLVTGPRRIGANWKAGLFSIGVGIPMTVVAVIWMMTPHVLYTPYLSVICLWNLTPLQDQQWSGFVMLAAALPLQLAGTWMLLNPRDEFCSPSRS